MPSRRHLPLPDRRRTNRARAGDGQPRDEQPGDGRTAGGLHGHLTPTTAPLAALLAVGLLLAACSDSGDDASGSGEPTDADSGATATADGGDDGAGDGSDDGGDDGSGDGSDGGGDDDAADDSDGTASGGAVDGALVSLLSFDTGLYVVDRGSGDHRAIEGLDDLFTDREDQPVLGDDDTAFTLTFAPLEGQSFSNEVGIARIDRTTGTAEQLAVLGVDRPDDESEDLTSYSMVGADSITGSMSVWVRSGPFSPATAEETVYTRYDASSGEALETLTDLVFEEVTDEGQCTIEVRSPIITADGEFIGQSAGWPVTVVGGGADVEQVVGCFEEAPTVASLAGADATDFLVPADPGSFPPEAAESIVERAEPTVSNNTMIAADGALWWIFNSSMSEFVDDEQVTAIVGGVTRYDRTTGEFEIYSLGDNVATWLEPDDTFQVSTLSQADLQFQDGALWIMDWRDDVPLLRLDVTSGAVTEIPIPLGDGIDTVEARLVRNDPEAIWLDVTRGVVVSEDENGQSTSGEGFIDQVDPTSGEFVVSVPQGEILGL